MSLKMNERQAVTKVFAERYKAQQFSVKTPTGYIQGFWIDIKNYFS
ncbi:MAG: hypothetical protein SFH39_07065 [Candidatus Magnetobacterium sp. LHC-1]|uniref:Uncharacterized protein n=1 Tax=Candidatus Magnetobacterium casense TaxID=1455061 RepID=A0ABS6RXK3_9BACT|nr:hypothetical protein [Candidatus Magnetobacterium casensis]MBF0607149.1 hypothetical protein [Nitrospirota bacterium]MBV6341360.1 hypothetical protein [Candidatus Magnetobacterium casensis]